MVPTQRPSSSCVAAARGRRIATWIKTRIKETARIKDKGAKKYYSGARDWLGPSPSGVILPLLIRRTDAERTDNASSVSRRGFCHAVGIRAGRRDLVRETSPAAGTGSEVGERTREVACHSVKWSGSCDRPKIGACCRPVCVALRLGRGQSAYSECLTGGGTVGRSHHSYVVQVVASGLAY